MLETRVKPPPGFSWRELLESSLAAMGATCCQVYLTAGEDGGMAQAAAWGKDLPGNESGRLAQQVILGGQVVEVETSPPSAAEPPGSGVAVGVPLEVEGQARGALLLGFPGGEKGHPETDAVGLALLLARLIGAHLLCAELRQTLAQREEHLDQLMRSTIEAQEAEREWICLEVHDGVAQTMASAFQHLQAYEAMPESRLREARPHVLRAAALVRQAIGESREVINSITPGPLSELGLEATLRQELRRFEEDTGCSVQFDAPKTRLPRETEVALYRIVHEAVTNVKKHAQSKSLEVEMHQERGRVSIRVKDSGVGFDLNLTQQIALGRGRGLFSMRKRAEILGGVCEVKSQPGQGTEVTVDVPLLPGNGA
jgi:signal transduction histidine kinase